MKSAIKIPLTTGPTRAIIIRNFAKKELIAVQSLQFGMLEHVLGKPVVIPSHNI